MTRRKEGNREGLKINVNKKRKVEKKKQRKTIQDKRKGKQNEIWKER